MILNCSAACLNSSVGRKNRNRHVYAREDGECTVIKEANRNMFTGYQSIEELTQNLIDAGCSKEMIAGLSSCLLDGNKEEGLSRLEERRAELLNDIHKGQSCIEYLDELLMSLREKNKCSRRNS